jgi:ATP-dependent DNA helicase RecQ
MLTDWIEETHDTEQPVSQIEDYLYESLADQSRSRNLGNGVFLSTVHSVKGLEFDHVFILGENWRHKSGAEMEEERRLYYVAMSRARETLQLFTIDNMANPHADALSGDFLLERRLGAVAPGSSVYKRYALLGMEDLFIDFAGIRKENSPCRKALAKAQCGDRLFFEERHGHLELVDDDGISVARLSQKAKQEWSPYLQAIEKIHIVAMIGRYRDDGGDDAYRRICHGEMWEVPIVEFSYTPPP